MRLDFGTLGVSKKRVLAKCCAARAEMAELGVSAGLLEVPQEPEIPRFVSGKNLDFAVRWESRM